jgi:hypothetical protein
MGIPPRPKTITQTGVGVSSPYPLDRFSSEVYLQGMQTAAGTAPTGTLTLSANASADDTVTIDTTVYTFKAAPAAAFEVDIGADAEGSIDNLVAAINLTGTAGTEYGTGTYIHPTVTAVKATASTMTATGKTFGDTADLIATTETGAQSAWGAATLVDGTVATWGVQYCNDLNPVSGSIWHNHATLAGETDTAEGSITVLPRHIRLWVSAANAADTVTLHAIHHP